MGIYMQGEDFYPAVISLEGRMYEARFVDFPNCIAVATSAREAEKRAEKALSIWLAIKKKNNTPLPPPSIVTHESSAAHRYVAYILAKPAEPDASADA